MLGQADLRPVRHHGRGAAGRLGTGECVVHREVDAAMSAGDRPPYLASGLAYIEFARTEPNLFTLLFMHRRTPEQMEQSSIQLRPVIEIIAQAIGCGV